MISKIIEKIKAFLSRNSGHMYLYSGIASISLLFIFGSSLNHALREDSLLAVMILLALCSYGGYGIIRGLFEISGEEKRERDKNYSSYLDPQWRKENPILAEQIAREKAKEYERSIGPAVVLPAVEFGYIQRLSYGYFWNRGYADSAGGFDVRCKIRNIGTRMIKYVNITLVAFNAVGDKCYSRINNTTEVNCQFTGPLMVDVTTDWNYWEHLWYDINPSRVFVQEIRVEFMDGKKQIIDATGNVQYFGD